MNWLAVALFGISIGALYIAVLEANRFLKIRSQWESIHTLYEQGQVVRSVRPKLKFILIGILIGSIFKFDFWFMPILGGIFGFFVFKIKEAESLKIRARQIEKQFPDFLDLLALTLSTGIGLVPAFSKIAGTLEAGPLCSELEGMIIDLRFGHSQESALKKFLERIHDDQITSVFMLVQQGWKRGVPLQTLLEDQAEFFRQKQLRALEKRAQTVGIKMLIPIMIFIFPAMFVILFGSLILQIAQGGSLF